MSFEPQVQPKSTKLQKICKLRFNLFATFGNLLSWTINFHPILGPYVVNICEQNYTPFVLQTFRPGTHKLTSRLSEKRKSEKKETPHF